MNLEAERLSYLKRKFNVNALELDNEPRRTTHEINLAEWTEQQAANERRNNATILKTRTVAYGGATDGKGLVRFWFEVTPDR